MVPTLYLRSTVFRGLTFDVTRSLFFIDKPRKFLYYYKGGGIWRMPSEGGDGIHILDQVEWRFWALLDQGICLLNRKAMPRPTIEFFNFANGRQTRITTIEKEPNILSAPGFAVSADGQWILYKHVDQIDNDIMLVENFR